MNTETYKWTSIILAILVAILLIALFAGNPFAGEPVEELTEEVSECNAELAEWREDNPAPYEWAAMATSARERLGEIISECSDEVREGTEELREEAA